MEKTLFSAAVLLLVQYTLAQVTDDPKFDSTKNSVSALLDELGHLILDFDEMFSRQTSPKVKFEDRMKEQMYGRPRSDYFNRIRENYRNIQRMGSISIGDLSVSSNLFGVNVKNDGRASAVDVSIPSLPMQLQVRSKIPTAEEYDSQVSGNAKGLPPKSSFASKFKLGDSHIKIDSTFAFPEASLKAKPTGRIPESGSKNLDNAEGLRMKVPESQFSGKIKLGESKVNIETEFPLAGTSNAKPKGIVRESDSKVPDSAEEIAKVPKPSFSTKIKMRNSAVKFNSAFSLPDDTSSKIEKTGKVDKSDSQLTDGAERFDRKSPEPGFASKIKVGDSRINIGSAFSLPDIPSKPEQIKKMGESNFQVSDSDERFIDEGTESHFASDLEVDSQMHADSAFEHPYTSAEQGMGRYFVVLGYLGEKEKREKRTPVIERAKPERIALFTKTYQEYLSNSDKQDRLWDIYTKARGRMLGDILFSESTFDKMTKEALRNAKWILDSDLSPRKVLDKLEEIAKSVLIRRSSEAFVPQQSDSEPDLSNDKDLAGDNPDPELPDFPEFKCPEDKSGTKSSNMEEDSVKETIISAITTDGVHVKLRMGPEVGNPFTFLHRILNAAEVSLSVEMTPKCIVESKSPDSQSFEMPPASLSIDMSNEKQLDSLLRTLQKFKNLESSL